MKVRRGVILAVLAAVAVGGALVARAVLTNTGRVATVRPHHVTDVREEDLSRTISASGTLGAREDERHRFAQGGRIDEIHVEEGQEVSKGDELMCLETQQQDLNLIQARNAYQEALIGGREADIEAQRLRVAVAERDLDARTLTARIGGSVREIGYREGDFLDPGSVAVRIVDTSGFLAAVNIDESESRHLEMGQEAMVEMDALPGRTFEGRITYIGATARREGGVVVVPAEITLDEVWDAFRPGYSVDVEIVVETARDALIVPITAVFEDYGREHVVVVSDAHEPDMVEVRTGIDDGMNMQIVSGLSGDDRVLMNVYQYSDLIGTGPTFPPRPGGAPGTDERGAEASQ